MSNYYGAAPGPSDMWGHSATEYGTYDDLEPMDELSKARSYGFHRRRLNVLGIICGYIIPWTMFCLVFWLVSFRVRYMYVAHTWIIAGAILLGILAFGAKAFNILIQRRNGTVIAEPHWKIFLTLTCLFWWFAAVYGGNQNYYWYMHPFFNLEGMKQKDSIDPATREGAEMMDVGRFHFVSGSYVDTTRAHGFKNSDMYCVAPVTSGAVNGTLESYDFWAVGINCCTGEPGDFAGCVEVGGLTGSEAVRFTFDYDRSFLRLAVEQASAKFAIKAKHPLFMSWTQDATALMSNYADQGYQHFVKAMVVSFTAQCLFTVIGTWFISRSC